MNNNWRNSVKKYLGLVWMICGPLAIILLISTAIKTIYSNAK